MHNNDRITREQARQAMMAAVQAGNTEEFTTAFNQMLESIEGDIRDEYTQQIAGLRQQMDEQVLTARGVRQLTGEEKTYYQKLAEAMRSNNPKQAVENLDVTMPKTVYNTVFEDLATNHPLLSAINFIPTGGAVQMILNTDGHQEAAWGNLCDEIVKELTGGFKEINTTLKKLSAFVPVCKAMLELGPEWLDRYIREILFEALANGLEKGIVAGDGASGPIGMNRKVGDDVAVTGGAYPEKEVVAVTKLDAVTVGDLVAKMAVTPSGKSRAVTDVILVVNTEDYFTKVMPATTLMAPDGSYRNDVLPYPIRIIPSAAKAKGRASIGLAKKYLAFAGISKRGRIEYSDHYHFVEDERMYVIKTYANGMPADNNCFIELDITNLQPAVWKVQMVDTVGGGE